MAEDRREDPLETLPGGLHETLFAASDGDAPTLDGTGGSAAATEHQHDRSRRATESAPVRIGRFTVLRRLGGGGMGVVWLAYDPELDRKIAIKVLRPERELGEDGRVRLVREAQAMAKLTHPNVVSVHEVGHHDGAVFVAMEYVEGVTLGRWLAERPRSWRETLPILLAAGRGLAAAHAAGLVHRDFKPDNVMVAADFRVLVMDFGLARPATTTLSTASETLPLPGSEPTALEMRVTQAGTILGTPAYMAPEQFRGGPVDAATDQFALCVTLWEAFYCERPFSGQTLFEMAAAVVTGEIATPQHRRARGIPRWLRAALERGLAVDPARRWPTISALLTELERGQTRVMRRRILGAVLATGGVIGGVAVFDDIDRRQRIADCEAAGAEITELWPGRAEQVRQGILATETTYAESTHEKLVPWLDGWAKRWHDVRTDTCEKATVDRTLSETLHRRVRGCADVHRAELQSLIDLLVAGDVQAAQRAVVVASRLPPIEDCGDVDRLARGQWPTEDQWDAVVDQRLRLARAASLQAAARYDKAIIEAEAVLAAASSIGWSPLRAEANVRLGSLYESIGEYDESERALRAAYFEAGAHGADSVASEAALELVWTVGEQQARHEAARDWGEHAAMLLSKLGEPSGLRGASLANHLAVVHLASGGHDEAIRLHQEALAIRRAALGPEHPDLASSLGNLANVHLARGDYTEAAALLERALDIKQRALGSDHPDVALVLNSLCGVWRALGSYDQALVSCERALRIREQALGSDHPHVAASLANISGIHKDRGAYDEALAVGERATALLERTLGADHPDYATALDNLGLVHRSRGAYDAALQAHERARTIRERVLGADHPDVARALNHLGAVHYARGDAPKAQAAWRNALAVFEKTVGPDHPHVAACLANLAALESEAENYDEAERLNERVLAIRERSLGAEHPDVGQSLAELADIRRALGRYTDARPMFERAVAILEKTVGQDHPDLAYPLAGLGETSIAERRWDEAVAVLERALALAERSDMSPAERADVRFRLARALWGQVSDRGRALTLARSAADELATAGEPGRKDLRRVETWLAGHRKAR